MSKQSELFASFIATGTGNLLTPRESRVVTQIAEGVHVGVIAESFQVTRERVRQIASKAARRINRINREAKAAKDFVALSTTLPSPLDIPLEELAFPIRLHYSLQNLRVEKLGDIVKLGRRGLLRGRGIGQSFMWRIDDTLAHFGLELPLEPSGELPGINS
ncbi:MAG: hypothetical protein ABR884_04320 [Minisyncoccia bacterium]|jgi:DNA-directed RNA polymerase alpha subunit